MKKYIFILFSLLFCACSENEILNTIDSEVTPEDSIITVSLNIVGDVQACETPITRVTEQLSSQDVLGIVVSGSHYVLGIFNSWSNLDLKLKAGRQYNIAYTLIKDAKTKLAWTNGWNYYPFYFTDYHPWNEFIYYESLTSFNSKIESRLRDGGVSISNYQDRSYSQAIDRFYGEVTNYTPTVDGVLELPLKRVSFGLKVKVSGITDGSVSVTCKNNYNTFYSNSNITSNIESEGQLFSMYNIYDAWQYADTDYQEPVELSVVWTRGNGIVQDLGTKTAYVKRNVMNIIKVRLSKNDTDVDVDVDPEEGDMGGEEEDLSN